MEKVLNFLKENFEIDGKKLEVSDENLSDFQKNIMNTITFGQYFFELGIEDYQYKLEYTDPMFSYDIYFKEDGSILVKKMKIDDDYDIVSLDSYTIRFDSDSMQALNEFIKRIASKENIVYRSGTLFKDEEPYIKSLIENDESYLKNSTYPKLLYTIIYEGINCLTPVLYLYDDGTYAYYSTFATDDQLLIPVEGDYSI
ncbi:MAG: hypothetical protein K2M17_04165, partial [Bacilli bacterium]|nr:hypothetical protein [Bacilli bacterium]